MKGGSETNGRFHLQSATPPLNYPSCYCEADPLPLLHNTTNPLFRTSLIELKYLLLLPFRNSNAVVSDTEPISNTFVGTHDLDPRRRLISTVLDRVIDKITHDMLD